MEETRTSFWKTSCDATPRDRRNQFWVTAWTLAWVLSWLAVSFAIRHDWLTTGTAVLAASLTSLVFGGGLVLAYRRFLREADELRRKIELEALAVAFGVGIVGGVFYWLLGRAGAVAEVDALWIVTGMIVTYSLAVVVGLRRYA